ncbi:MAG TPA: hypothetical protein DC042_02470, partial [Bacteroidales bacterium]|nr:hypothetical protein [Bacteroidales bacterium]
MKQYFNLIPGLFIGIQLLTGFGCSIDSSTDLGLDKAKNPPNFGQRQEIGFDSLKSRFGNPDMIYAPFVFWFWDEPLNPDKMAE